MALRLVGRVGVAALSKQMHLAGIELYKPERGTNGRCLAGAVCAHKATIWPGSTVSVTSRSEKRSLTRREAPLSSSKFCMV